MGLLSLAIWTPIAFGTLLLLLGREQQAGTVGISFSSSGDDFLDIAREVSHNKIALGTANGKRHEKQARR